MSEEQTPIILSISGHDPVGGAGIQADIEAIVANKCQAATVITCLTVQDTLDVWRLQPVEPELLEQEARAVLDDLPVAAIKIGLMGSEEIVTTIADLLKEFPGIPVILDPVLAAGGGMELAGRALEQEIRDQLLPLVTLITPNSPEARRLSGEEELELCGRELLALGCGNVLITGAHEKGAEVENRLYKMDGSIQNWSWPRLGESYHGSGCTLASAAAALLARGLPLVEALEQAQAYTWKSLYHARRPGRGQALPDRLHALVEDPSP
jgi:hydroxymethylpyrimidine/phosphomethylpyrimidine kinase